MKFFRPLTPRDMRTINRTAVLEIIRTEGPVSRGHIAGALGLSLPSVVRIVDDLRADNLVRPTGKSEFSGGRKRPLLEINTTDNLSIGIDLGGTKAYGAICDLRGEILCEYSVNNHKTHGADSYDVVKDLIGLLLSHARKEGLSVAGIGIGVPGVTEPQSGVVQRASSLKWKNFPLKKRLEKDFGLTTAVDNDVNSAALGEMWFGHGKNVSNLVLVALGTGIGAGLIMDGILYRGANLCAGEIGYIPWDKSCLDQEYPEFGPLEFVASGLGIAEQAKKRAIFSPDVLGEVTAQDVFEACGRGEERAKQLVEEIADYLAMALISVCSIADPDVIVIGGGISHSADLFIDRVRSRMEGRMPQMPRVEISALRERATVLGTMINLLHLKEDFCVVRSMS
jgi:glucokinase-like ROK family protein